MGVVVRRYIDILTIIIYFPTPLVLALFMAAVSLLFVHFKNIFSDIFKLMPYIIESVDSISRDERGFPLTQYITNGRISQARYTVTHFKHHYPVLWLISNRMSV